MTRQLEDHHNTGTPCPVCAALVTELAEVRGALAFEMARTPAIVTASRTVEGWVTITDVDPPGAVEARISMDLLRQMVDELNEGINLRTERDAAFAEAAALPQPKYSAAELGVDEWSEAHA
jgi:hypothetical protein